VRVSVCVYGCVVSVWYVCMCVDVDVYVRERGDKREREEK